MANLLFAKANALPSVTGGGSCEEIFNSKGLREEIRSAWMQQCLKTQGVCQKRQIYYFDTCGDAGSVSQNAKAELGKAQGAIDATGEGNIVPSFNIATAACNELRYIRNSQLGLPPNGSGDCGIAYQKCPSKAEETDVVFPDDAKCSDFTNTKSFGPLNKEGASMCDNMKNQNDELAIERDLENSTCADVNRIKETIDPKTAKPDPAASGNSNGNNGEDYDINQVELDGSGNPVGMPSNSGTSSGVEETQSTGGGIELNNSGVQTPPPISQEPTAESSSWLSNVLNWF